VSRSRQIAPSFRHRVVNGTLTPISAAAKNSFSNKTPHMTISQRLLAFGWVTVLSVAALAEEPPVARPANHLARESSPYLLHHAHNLVDWYPWGEAAFAKAKAEDKLIFLSSGYHACHWCHVMERESFLNAEVAALLNRHFVCIKLDREERPDVDHIYLTALNVMGQNGGWPLSMFLTANGNPIAGGTYWPPDDREIAGDTVPGFKTVLKSVIEFQKNAPEDIQQTAELRAEQTRRALTLGFRLGGSVEPNRELVTSTVARLQETFDPQHGGFGRPEQFRGPKFPRPPSLQLLQAEAARTKSADIDRMVQTTLEQMALGGIYDQLGGGFHRYSTERTWTVPHFEKMLYDNGQLLELYAAAFAQTKNPLYERVLRDTLAFVDRELTSPTGVFYTSLDADTSGEEGRYYVWTDEELAAALPAAGDLAFVKAAYGVDGPPNFEERFRILVRRSPVSEQDQPRLQALQRALLAARERRTKPNLDTKVLTSWNGLMIAGMASAGRALHDPAAIDRAGRAADFLLKTMRTADGRLLHSYAATPGEPARARIAGYLDDYTALVHGLLALHEATSNARWLASARELTDAMIAHHHDVEQGGFFYTAHDHEPLFVRTKDQNDGVQPSGNTQAARNLLRLGKLTGDGKSRRLAEETLRTFAGTLKDQPTSLCGMAEALATSLDRQEAP
jgi:uncharacterized protein YyaL (SSP411 family)